MQQKDQDGNGADADTDTETKTVRKPLDLVDKNAKEAAQVLTPFIVSVTFDASFSSGINYHVPDERRDESR